MKAKLPVVLAVTVMGCGSSSNSDGGTQDSGIRDGGTQDAGTDGGVCDCNGNCPITDCFSFDPGDGGVMCECAI